MTKPERIKLIEKEFELKKSEAEKLEEKYMGMIKKELKEHGEFKLDGIGTLKIMKVEEKAGRNPRTGEPLVIPEHKALKFKVENKFKNEIK